MITKNMIPICSHVHGARHAAGARRRRLERRGGDARGDAGRAVGRARDRDEGSGRRRLSRACGVVRGRRELSDVARDKRTHCARAVERFDAEHAIARRGWRGRRRGVLVRRRIARAGGGDARGALTCSPRSRPGAPASSRH